MRSTRVFPPGGALPAALRAVLALLAAGACACAFACSYGCTYGGYDAPSGGAAGAVPGGGVPGGPMAVAGPTGGAGPLPAGAGGLTLTGTVSLSTDLAPKARPTDVLYVIVRAAPVGPPIAVKKIAAPAYPAPFSLGDADLMGAGAVPSSLWLIARVDRDGNAGPLEPGDLEGVFPGNPIANGATGIAVVVDREHTGAAMAPTAPMAPAAAPLGFAPAPGLAPAPAGPGVSGTVELDPARASNLAATDVLFVIVRDAPVGPPLAVKRVAGPRFPLSFEVGPADAMGGPGTWTAGPFWVSARLDKDGNAMSKGAGDVAGKIDAPVAAGPTGLRVLLVEAL